MANEFIIKNGFHSKGDSQVTGSLTATSFSGDGSALTNLPAASANNFGIAQGSGSFTYYSSLSSSMAAATSGDTVQMFSDYVERTSSVSLKDGVTLDGNGFTYTFSGSGTQNALEETSAATSTIYLNNLIVKRIGGAAASTTENLALYVGASNQDKTLYNQNVLMENDSGCAITATGGGSGNNKVYDITARGTTYGIYFSYGYLYHSKGYATTGTGIYGSSNSGRLYQSYGESEDGVGIYAAEKAENCVGVSGESYGLQVAIPSTNGSVIDCIGISAGTGGGDAGIYNTSTSGILQDCEGYGNAGPGIYTQLPVEIVNCTGNSKSGYGIYLRNANAKAINCHAHSVSSYAAYSQDGGKFLDCSFYAQAQHGILIANSSTDIIGCSIEVEDASKNCIYAASSYDIDLAANVYKGATTAVNANLTNVCTNVPDEQGNIHVTSSVNNDRIYSGSFSGSYVGDGSGLTNLPASSVLTSSYTSEWILGADGTDHYTFSGPGLTGAENDPDIYLVRGQKYRFYNNSGGHPFRIQSTPNGSAGTAYNDGVTNNDAGDGTYLLFDVQFDAPTKLYYQCTSHANMGGPIYIADENDFRFTGSAQITGSLFVTGPTFITGSFTVTDGDFIPRGRNNAPTNNVIIGEDAGIAVHSSGLNNVYIGKEAGEAASSGDSNVAIGWKAGETSNNDSNCILIGFKAGGSGTLGNHNIFLGYEAGRDAASTHGSIGIGSYALHESDTGGGSGYNTALGYAAGYSITSGNYNLFLGHYAGYDITTGANNIFIGSGSLGETGTTNQLRIGHSNLIAISASLATGDILLQGDVSSSATSTASFGTYLGDGSQLTETDPFPYTGSAIISGSLEMTGSISLAQPSASVYISGKVPVTYPVVAWDYNTDVRDLWSDNYIKLSWDPTADFELNILQLGSGGEGVQWTWTKGGTTTEDEATSTGQFDWDSNFASSAVGVGTIACMEDSTWPWYRVTLHYLDNGDPGIYFFVEKTDFS